MTLRIITFGTLCVRADRGAVAGAAAQPRRLALLALLARAGERGVTREKVTALVWPDSDDERSRRAITQGIYALRQELGSDDTILGVKELRLNTDLVASDVAEFSAACRTGRPEDAVRVYAGPFLDGFHLPGNDEFDRWIDAERSVLTQEHSEALERLANAADARGDHGAATGWWRRLSAKDPLSARYATAVMRALSAAGDKHGALEHARIHETLLEQHLDLPADRDVVALAARIRRELRAGARAEAELQAAAVGVEDPPDSVPNASEVAAFVDTAPPPNTPTTDLPQEPVAVPSPPFRVETRVVAEPVPSAAIDVRSPIRQPGQRARRVALVAASLGFAAVAVLVARALRTTAQADTTPVVAVGRITDYSASADSRYGASIADLLSTNLARVSGLRVVSAARMLELMRQTSTSNDTSAAGVLAAARRAGATELVDGIVYTRPDGRLRLDLRRVGIATGDILQAHTVEGPDLFALVDSGTARLVAAHGGVPPGSIAGVTTRSVAAYSLYAQGLRVLADGDGPGARRLFAAALREDSTFAMAAYNDARLAPTRADLVAGMGRALRLSARASERERLMIRAGWAWTMSSHELGSYADSLATRYPQETQGHLYQGIAKLHAGDFLAAVRPLERAVAMDSLSFTRSQATAGCDACTGMLQLVLAYVLSDSLDAAERVARRWARLDSASARPWVSLWDVLERSSQFAEAERVAARIAKIDRDAIGATDRMAMHAIRTGNFELADPILRSAIQSGSTAAQMEALWDLCISLRYQGRAEEAATVARRFRELAVRSDRVADADAPIFVRPLAQSLFEAGRFREAAALFDSSANWHGPNEIPEGWPHERVWDLAHAARSLAAAGDTGVLEARADTISAVGALSSNGRDRRLGSYIRGLLLLARGDHSAGISAIRASIYSLPGGYTRENFDLARAELRIGRPRDAIAVLQPVMRGKLDASNMYVTQTEVHELLAQAWEAAGRPDSASAHYAWVARAWEHGDPPYAKRAADARVAIARMASAR